MALLSVYELVDIVVMTLLVGYLFKDIIRRPAAAPQQRIVPLRQSADGSYGLEHDPQFLDLGSYFASSRKPWYSDLAFAMLVTAPAIVLHEFGHKFVAMAFGLQATFHAAYGGLLMGLFLKWFLGFIVFIPAYVSIFPATLPLNDALISIAGPLVNLALWLGARYCLKHGLLKGHEHALIFIREINRLLFILNMIPFPGFDGYWFFSGLIKALLGLF